MNTILRIRKQLSVSQSELAAELGCSQANISFYERGQTVPPDTARRLIEVAAKRGLVITFNDVYAAVPADQHQAAA